MWCRAAPRAHTFLCSRNLCLRVPSRSHTRTVPLAPLRKRLPSGIAATAERRRCARCRRSQGSCWRRSTPRRLPRAADDVLAVGRHYHRPTTAVPPRPWTSVPSTWYSRRLPAPSTTVPRRAAPRRRSRCCHIEGTLKSVERPQLRLDSRDADVASSARQHRQRVDTFACAWMVRSHAPSRQILISYRAGDDAAVGATIRNHRRRARGRYGDGAFGSVRRRGTRGRCA